MWKMNEVSTDFTLPLQAVAYLDNTSLDGWYCPLWSYLLHPGPAPMPPKYVLVCITLIMLLTLHSSFVLEHTSGL
jgi:hypothetical protein